MVNKLLLISIAVVIYISIIFLIAWSKKRLDIVDVAWGGGFIIAALTSLMMGERGTLQLLVTGLVMIWGIRLAYHILRRVIATKEEDPRYTEMRSHWKGNPALNAYFRIFVTQGLLATIISASVIWVNLSNSSSVNILVWVGVMFWVFGFLFESIGDAQLKYHLANPVKKGKLMTGGLWKYTRHPNYFGEATQWWAIYIIALSVPFGWMSIIGPLLITYLLLFVSGVKLTERRFEGRPGWDEYKKHTSIFIPWFPKNNQ